ncbi:MAG: hypothetical protein ACI89L_002188 [Phycisphaerales bacterium]|jgi:hypothetical protein
MANKRIFDCSCPARDPAARSTGPALNTIQSVCHPVPGPQAPAQPEHFPVLGRNTPSRVWRGVNAWRARIFGARPACAMAAVFSVVAVQAASAQLVKTTTNDPPPKTVPRAPSEPARVSPADAIVLFETVEGWVRAAEAPETLPQGAPFNTAAFTTPTFGASVIIRLDGRVVGRGVRVSPDAATGFVLAAAQDAIRVARAELEEAGDDAPITVSLELADRLIPMALAQGEELAMRMSPGLDGLAMRRGSQTAAWFPSQMLERNSLPSTVLGPLVTLLGGPTVDKLKPASDLVADGYTIYRFRTTQLVTPLPGLSPVFLHRGGRVVNASALDRPGLLAQAQGLISHLAALQWPGAEPFGLSGALEPITGQRASGFADPIVQGAAAMALLRAAHVTGLDPATAERSRAAGERLLRELGEVAEGESEPWGTASSAAACILGLAELSPERLEMDPGLAALRESCLQTVRDAFDSGTGFAGTRGSETALVAMALVRDAQFFGGEIDKAMGAVNTVYRDTPPGMLVAQMPWLGWASVGLAEASDGPIAAATRLRAMRDLIWDHRLRTDDLSYDDRDLAGGIVFTSGTTPLPTWQSVRPVAFLATMVGLPELTTGGVMPTGEIQGEWPLELVRVLESLRFFMQLSAGVEEGHLYRRPGLARWGVRASLWDHSMPTQASVLTLLAVCETLDVIEAPPPTGSP